jgi:hypothetical protein
MRFTNLRALALAAGALTALGGCQFFGPNSIGLGRDRYNSVIQSTSMEQTMANIVRVYNHEPTLFMDVTEVDATLSFGGSLAGAATSIGAEMGTRVSNSSATTYTGRLGSAQGTVQYSETPTIRYQPLLGQALVAQMVTPVSVDALGLLYDSYWDIAPLLDFALAYLTLNPDEFYAALNTIIELNNREALELVAGKSGLPKSPTSEEEIKTPSASGTSKGAGNAAATGNDSLFIYLRPFHPHAGYSDPADKQRVLVDKQRVFQLWVRMLRIYLDNQPMFDPPSKCKATIGLTLDAKTLQDWDVNIGKHVTGSDDQKDKLLDSARDCLPSAIELRVVPVPMLPKGKGRATSPPINIASHAPLMRTYSALGILKDATERPHPKIEFVTPQQYREIRYNDAWNGDVDNLNYYTLLSSQEDSIDCSDDRKQIGGCDNPPPSPSEREDYKKLTAEIDCWIQLFVPKNPPPCTSASGSSQDTYLSGLDVSETKGRNVLDNKYIKQNRRLGLLRRYILVIVDDHLPLDSVYASYSDGDRWYYIAKDDPVSEKNFDLLSLFLTMMAIAPSTQPLSPVINVGG